MQVLFPLVIPTLRILWFLEGMLVITYFPFYSEDRKESWWPHSVSGNDGEREPVLESGHPLSHLFIYFSFSRQGFAV